MFLKLGLWSDIKTTSYVWFICFLTAQDGNHVVFQPRRVIQTHIFLLHIAKWAEKAIHVKFNLNFLVILKEITKNGDIKMQFQKEFGPILSYFNKNKVFFSWDESAAHSYSGSKQSIGQANNTFASAVHHEIKYFMKEYSHFHVLSFLCAFIFKIICFPIFIRLIKLLYFLMNILWKWI